jgi:uncharacterized membrane protein YgdD (TMEM256/DUF423 family)
MYHALLLLLLGVLMGKNNTRLLKSSAMLAFAGTLCFSGSLYLLTVAGWNWMGPVTPLGGLLLMAAWILLIIHFIREKAQ